MNTSVQAPFLGTQKSTSFNRHTVSLMVSYGAVILIWASSPLAIQWSMQEMSLLFSLMFRMVLGLVLAIIIMWGLNKPMPMDKMSLRVYGVSGLGLGGATLLVYWGVKHIPSGWVAVVFGLSPLMSGLAGLYWLQEPFGISKRLGVGIGLAGLVVLFASETVSETNSMIIGICSVLSGALVYSITIIWIKKLRRSLSPLALTTGSLAVMVPLFFVVWILVDGQVPSSLNAKTWMVIVYLSLVNSVLSKTLVYYILSHVQAHRVALISLISPVVALWLGSQFNGEVLQVSFMWGAGLMLIGLAVYQFGYRWVGFKNRFLSRVGV